MWSTTTICLPTTEKLRVSAENGWPLRTKKNDTKSHNTCSHGTGSKLRETVTSSTGAIWKRFLNGARWKRNPWRCRVNTKCGTFLSSFINNSAQPPLSAYLKKWSLAITVYLSTYFNDFVWTHKISAVSYFGIIQLLVMWSRAKTKVSAIKPRSLLNNNPFIICSCIITPRDPYTFILRKWLISYKNVCPWSSERFSWHGSSALAWINQRTSGIVNIAQNIISNVIFAYTKFICPLVVRGSDGQISWTYLYMVAWTVSRKSFLGRKTRFQSTLGYFYN